MLGAFVNCEGCLQMVDPVTNCDAAADDARSICLFSTMTSSDLLAEMTLAMTTNTEPSLLALTYRSDCVGNDGQSG
jgi:hypothetical protein